VIRPLPGKPGVLAATGHGMLGLTLAPGTATEVTWQATTGSVSGNARPLSIERLAGARFS
jgi:glycine/D-amino acid oxidase-like deaminating enzyme